MLGPIVRSVNEENVRKLQAVAVLVLAGCTAPKPEPTPAPVVQSKPQALSTNAVVFTSAIPADRLTLWSPGIPNGIPNRTQVCANVAAGGNIQSAINGCAAGQVVQLVAGTYGLTSGLQITKGITLRGAGAGVTILKRSGFSEPTIRLGTGSGYGASLNFAADGVKESFTATLSSTSGLSVGKLVLIDKKNDAALTFNAPDCDANCQTWFSRSGRQLATVNKIAAISGNVVTFAAPLHILWDVAHAAQVSPFTATATFQAGVEGLTLDNNGMPSGAADGSGPIMFSACDECWTANLETFASMGGYHVNNSFRSEIRAVYSHDTRNPNPGGEGYSFDISQASAETLLTDSISVGFNKVMIMRAGGQGNVVSYSYFDHGFISSAPGWNETGINQGHMTTTAYTLFEGNYGFNCDAEIRWGGSVYATFFRNHCSGVDKGVSAGNAHAAKVDARNYFFTYAGNVLGTAAASGWTYEGNGDNSIWALGAPDPGGTPGISGNDAQVKATLVRVGNFDYKSNAVVNPAALPDSLYLDSAPQKWVTPEGATKLGTLWAKQRFDAGTPNAVNPNPGPTPTPPGPTPTPPGPTPTPSPTVSPTPGPTPTPGTLPVLAVQDISTPEGNSGKHAVVFTVTLTPASTAPVTVVWTTANATAISDTGSGTGDFEGLNASLTFAPGETSKTVSINVLGDTTIEPDEYFTFTISNPVGATIGRAQARATIVNDDSPGPTPTPKPIPTPVPTPTPTPGSGVTVVSSNCSDRLIGPTKQPDGTTRLVVRGGTRCELILR